MSTLALAIGASLSALWNVAGHYAALPDQMPKPITYVYGCAGILAGLTVDAAMRGERNVPLADVYAVTAATGAAVITCYLADSYRRAQAQSRVYARAKA